MTRKLGQLPTSSNLQHTSTSTSTATSTSTSTATSTSTSTSTATSTSTSTSTSTAWPVPKHITQLQAWPKAIGLTNEDTAQFH